MTLLCEVLDLSTMTADNGVFIFKIFRKKKNDGGQICFSLVGAVSSVLKTACVKYSEA